MKRQVVEKLGRENLLSDLPGFVITRGIIHKTPIAGLLRGFWFDSSAFDKHAAYVYVFVQPLYVPSEGLSLTFSRRLEFPLGLLRSSERWDLPPEKWEEVVPALRRAMIRDGLPFLRKRDSIELFVRNLRYGFRVENTFFDREALAYSLAWLACYREAAWRLKWLIRSIKPDDPWRAARENAEQLLRAIRTGPESAKELLRRWEEETSRHLYLGEWLR